MNNTLIDGITNIDIEVIEKYFKYHTQYAQNKSVCTANIKKRIQLVSLIASCCLIFAFATTYFIHLITDKQNPTYNLIERTYKENIKISIDENAREWPWEYKATQEKFLIIDINGVTYSGHQQEVNEKFIGKKLGTFYATGYDNLTDSDDYIHHEYFECYEITDVSSRRLIAVMMNEKYYVFETDIYSPPNSLDELFDEYGLVKTVELKKFNFYDGQNNSDDYVIMDGKQILDTLAEISGAASIEPIGWHETKHCGVKFIVDSEHLGIENKIIFVTTDGYIWTDMFNGEYLYFIGETASKSIIEDVTDHSLKQEKNIYEKSIIGTIISIDNDYLWVDDSIMCTNTNDGIIFKISLHDTLIKRYFDLNYVNVGDIVKIDCSNSITVTSQNLLANVISVSKVKIENKEIIIHE